MKPSPRINRRVLAGIAIIFAVALIGLSASPRSSSDGAASQTTDSQKSERMQREAGTAASAGSRSIENDSDAAISRPDTNNSAAILSIVAHENDLSKLLDYVRRTDSLFIQEYAVFAPSELCLAIRVAPQGGLRALIDSKAALLPIVEKQLLPTTLEPRRHIQTRCAPYSRDGHLRDALAKELIGRGLVSRAQALRWADEGGQVSETTVKAAKLALETILADPNAAILWQLSKSSIARWSQEWVIANLPLEYRSDAYPLSIIASEIAACRSGAPCDGGSIARDAVCAKYGECVEPDVESSYQRLHALYQVPFGITESLVVRYQRAISSKNANLVFDK